MIKAIRQQYNAAFTQERYEAFLKHMEELFHKEVIFRLAETPVFVDKAFKAKLISACEQIIDEICKPGFKQLTERAIPEKYKVQNENGHPHFICIDFGVCEDENGVLSPQMIELQGFASLFAWQDLLGQKYKEFFYCPENFTHLLSGK